MGSMYDDTPTSRFEEDMRAIIDGTPWPERPPKSKMEELLEELNDLIKAGGGGGGGTSTIAWKPSVASDGTISWTRTASETAPEEQNIKGPAGQDGTNGADGKDGADGLGIKQVSINLENHLIITYDDDTTEDAGALPEWSSTLSALTDTAITSPTNGQVLTYNSTTSKWENADGGETKDTVGYRFVTKSTSGHEATITVSKYLNGVLDSSTDYGYGSIADRPIIIDGYISFVYKTQQTSWEYTILRDSLSGHSVGYSYSWSYLETIDAEEEFYISEDTLAGLNDVAIVSPTAAQPLTYDSTNNMWVNGGIVPAVNGGTGNATGYVQAGRKANTNIGTQATAEGTRNTASGNQSHAEGADTTASNTAAHAEGSNTQATGLNSHAEGGGGVVASGGSSHAEGTSTTASGNYSHAEGQGTKAQAIATHAQNFNTTASANYSSAAGYYTTAGYQNQFVVGKYNDNKSTSILEVGIGTANNAKANGLELDTSGNLKVAGTIRDGNGNVLKDSPKVHILDTESTDVSSTTYIPLANISTFPTCEVGDIIVLKVNANYTFNTTAGGYWMFKINDIGYMMRLLWADESDFNQDLPKGSCVVFVYNHNILFDDFLTVASFDVKNFDPSTVIQKSQTAGLLKNDGTVDTTTYASEAGTESLINSTVGWTGKNLLPSTAVTQSLSGVTFTVNSDKSVTLTNSANAAFTYVVFEGSIEIPANCVFSAGRIPASSTQIYVVIDGTAYYVPADGTFVEIPSGTLTYCKIYGNQYFAPQSAVTYYPMVYDKRITDPTYEPYHKSVEEELSAIHSIPSGGTAGQVLAKASGTDYDLEWANMAGGAKVHTWETTTTDQSDMWLVLTLTSTPVLAVGDIYVIKVKADYVGYDFQSYGTTTYGIRFTNGGSTVSWTNCISAGVDGSGNDVPFTPDIHEGDVITLLCTNASTPKFLLLSSNKNKEYCEATITLSTSATTTATFYNAGITSDSVLEVGVSEWGLVPDSVSMSSTGIATAVFPAVDSARSVTVRLYIK